MTFQLQISELKSDTTFSTSTWSEYQDFFQEVLNPQSLGRYPSSGCFLHEYLGSCRLRAAVIGPRRTACEVGNYADGVGRPFVLEEMHNISCKTCKVSCRFLKNCSLISELSCGATMTSGSKD